MSALITQAQTKMVCYSSGEKGGGDCYFSVLDMLFDFIYFVYDVGFLGDYVGFSLCYEELIQYTLNVLFSFMLLTTKPPYLEASVFKNCD